MKLSALSGTLLFVFLVHISYIQNGFIWLDQGDILEKRAILPLQHLGDIFFLRFGETGFFRPLVTLLHSLDYAVYGLFAPGYHLTNLFLHMAVVAAAPLFLSAFFVLTVPQIIIVMTIVGIHPLSTLPTGAISYRPELLVTFFIFITVFLHAKTRQNGNQWIAFWTLLSFFLALLSKETAFIILPALLILWELLQKGKKNVLFWPLVFSEVMVIGIYFIFRLRAVPELWSTHVASLTLGDALGTRLLAFGTLISRFFTVTHVPISDAVHIVTVFSYHALLVLGCLGVCIFFIWKYGVRSFLGRWIILFLLLLSPALAIVPLPRLGSPHYGYLPLALFAFLLAHMISFSIKKFHSYKYFIIVALCLMFAILSWTTFSDGYRFKNDKTLFEPEVQNDPHFLEGHFYLGNWYLKQYDFSNAEQSYRNALQETSDVVAFSEPRAILINLSSIYLLQNQLRKVDEVLTEAEYVEDTKYTQKLMHNRMVYFYKKGDFKSVFQMSQDGRAFPYAISTYVVLIDSLHHLGKEQEAKKLLKIFLRDSTQEQRMQYNKLKHDFRIDKP